MEPRVEDDFPVANRSALVLWVMTGRHPVGERVEVAMASRGSRLVGEAELEDAPAKPSPDVATILDNVVRLDQMLDEGSRRELAEMPYLELSKHLKIKKTAEVGPGQEQSRDRDRRERPTTRSS